MGFSSACTIELIRLCQNKTKECLGRRDNSLMKKFLETINNKANFMSGACSAV
jgi:hypothetical protein